MNTAFGLKRTNSFVCRIPNKAFDDYNVQECDTYSMNEYIINKLSDKHLMLAIYLASPSLYHELIAFQKEGNYKQIPAKKLRSIYCSFIGYVNRLSTRATPFGMFSSTLNGVVKDDVEGGKYIPDTRLSIEFDGAILHQIANKLLENNQIKHQTRFFTNNTFFKFGKRLNYIEFGDSVKREFNVSSLDDSVDLEEILRFCEKGQTYTQISDYLRENGFNPENIDATVDMLISNKILISELEPDIIGRTYHQQIFAFVERNKQFVDVHILNAFNQLDSLTADSISLEVLQDIKNELSAVINVDSQTCFNINSFNSKPVSINNKVSDDVEKGFKYYLSYCSNKPEKEREISTWIHSFMLKFDSKFVQLKKALDPEAGCYYGENLNCECFDKNSLIDKLPFDRTRKKHTISRKLDDIDDFILKQTVNCIKGGTHEVVLPEELVESKLDYNALPLTINAMCLIGKKENENYICYEDAITDSALTLIGRFTPYDNGIKNLCNDLATWEQNKLPSCMVCEFGHVTTYEDCNIMSRDIDRKYILPYLNHAEGGKKTEVLDFDNIYVGVYENKIVFFDVEKKKQVIPVMSHSQNYNKELLPIYKFVGDVQMHNCAHSKIFARDNSYLGNIFGFQPRVRYGNYIFSLAKWVVLGSDIRKFFSLDIDSKVEKVKEYLKSRNIPMEFSIVSGDMKLYINLDTLPTKSIIIIEKFITNKSSFLIEEYFYSEYHSLLNNEGKSFVSEYVFPFKNENANYEVNTEKDNNYIYAGFQTPKMRVFLPNNDWLYFKIYCEYSVSDMIISENLIKIKESAMEQGLIDKWHFLRYKDMQGHQIRIRYHLVNPSMDNTMKVYSLLKDSLSKYTIDEIHTIKIDTYTRELERYGADIYDDIEDIFSLDSDIHSKALKYLESDSDIRLLLGLYVVKRYADMQFSSDKEKLEFVQMRVEELSKDYHGGKEQRTYFNQKFHAMVKPIENFFSSMDEGPLYELFAKIEAIYKKGVPEEILPLLIHMSLDRLYKSRNRLNEYAAYSLMERYYKKMLFQNVDAAK